MLGYIYLTTNNINNKKYIGRKVSSAFVESYLGSGVALRSAIEKYGKENFSVEIIEAVDDFDTLVQKEMYWIEYYDAVNNPNFYNHSPGGKYEGWLPGDDNIAKTDYCRKTNSEKHKGKKQSSEQIEKRVSKTSGENHWTYGKPRLEETKDKIRKTLTGRKLSDEHKAAIGRGGKGKPHIFSEESKQHIIDKASKPVKNLDTGEVFSSVKAAIEKYPVGNIYSCCRGRAKTAGGYHWKYIEED